MKHLHFLVLLSLLFMCACGSHVVDRHPPIQYVKNIILSKSGPEVDLLHRSKVPVPSGDVCIIGSEQVCSRLAGLFENYDVHDNVDGSLSTDGLPDFSGETFACISDTSSFMKLLKNGGDAKLREKTVRMALAALDTVSHISPYDLEGMASKNTSKIIILADPVLAQYGKFDVDTLFNSTGCRVTVLSPLDLMLDEVFSAAGKAPVNIGFICDSNYVSSKVYDSRFKAKAAEYGSFGSDCFIMSDAHPDSLLYRMLDSYVASGYTKPLDAIIVDDLNTNVDSLKLELADMTSIMNESSMTYGKLISKNFTILGAFDEVARCCYLTLRNNNLFTHNISKPQVFVYRPVPSPDSKDGSIILIPGSYVQ